MSALTTTQPPMARAPSHLLVAGILQMVLRNGIAASLNRTRPCGISTLSNIRTQLLDDPFFDRSHQPEELHFRTRPSRILLMDFVLLLAMLFRVLIRQGPLTDEEKAERIAVRNEALDQPFFDRERTASRNPFADGAFEDEGCFV